MIDLHFGGRQSCKQAPRLQDSSDGNNSRNNEFSGSLAAWYYNLEYTTRIAKLPLPRGSPPDLQVSSCGTARRSHKYRGSYGDNGKENENYCSIL